MSTAKGDLHLYWSDGDKLRNVEESFGETRKSCGCPEGAHKQSLWESHRFRFSAGCFRLDLLCSRSSSSGTWTGSEPIRNRDYRSCVRLLSARSRVRLSCVATSVGPRAGRCSPVGWQIHGSPDCRPSRRRRAEYRWVVKVYKRSETNITVRGPVGSGQLFQVRRARLRGENCGGGWPSACRPMHKVVLIGGLPGRDVRPAETFRSP